MFNVEEMEGGLSGGFGESGNELESVPRVTGCNI